jgi:methyltransferase family protein
MSTQAALYRDYPCDLCGANTPIEIPHCRLYTAGQPIHVCGDCGFVYVRSRRSSEEIARVWSEEIYGGVYTAVRNPAVISRQVFVAEFLAGRVGLEGAKVCDIGAGEGFFLKYLKDQYRVDPFGIEPSKENCSRLEHIGIQSFMGTIEQFVASEERPRYRADVATIMWTLENCLSCVDMLKGASALLPIGGKIVVATGSRILVPFKKPLFAYFSHTPADSHCFRFSANALQTALAKAGFKTTATNRYLDNDILCVLAEKMPDSESIAVKKDHPLEVLAFFERWHHDSVHYVRDWPG